MRSLVSLSIAIVSFASTGVEAADLSKALRAPIKKSWESRQTIHDTERCLILADAGSLPYVYKQADRPDKVILAYAPGMGVLAIELTQTASGVRIDVRGSGMSASRVPESFEKCV